ncbi:MAG: hypothetical protein LLG15_02090 [Betaproteobacteria bacterium]|nr:hypothetical protein [Betaproteobacteria bacterium]
MSKYREGQYLIRLFDIYGTPCGWAETQTTSVSAVKEGRRAISAGECDSFAVMRVFYNSVAHQERWLPSPERLAKALAIIKALEAAEESK